MKLNLALQADIGDTVTTTGTVFWVRDPKNIVGEHNGKPYNFWAQFVVIKDGDSSLGVNLSFNNATDKVNKGDTITVKGIMDSYEKDGKTVLKLEKAKILAGSAPAPKPQAKTSNGSNIDRQSAVKSVLANANVQDIVESTDKIMKIISIVGHYIQTGENLMEKAGLQSVNYASVESNDIPLNEKGEIPTPDGLPF